MTARFCAREADVLELVAIGQWPRQASDDLAAHVVGCAACSDVVMVALALRDGDDQMTDTADVAVVPDAAAVWQRAQWRARQEAMRVASRPVVAAQAVAAIGILALIAGGTAWLMNLLPDRGEIAGTATDRASSFFAAVAASWSSVARVAGETSPSLMWILPLAVGGIVGAVGLALLLSTIADLASDRPAR